MEILLLFAFISGLITIFAPCIWPLLPIILSASTSGGRRKPLGITLGIIISFALITLTISYIVKIIPFDPEILRYFAVFVIGLLGLTLVIPVLSQKLEGVVSKLSGRFGSVSTPTKTGFGSGFVTGFALGIVWTPCAGPILATIATLAATQAVNFHVVLVTIVYVIGVGIPLFLFATAGNTLFTKSRLLSKYTGRIQQVFGVIMILTAISIATNYDKTLQARLLDAFPSYGNFLTKFESNETVKRELDALKNPSVKPGTSQSPTQESSAQVAPEFTGITNWLNLPAGEAGSKPLTMQELRGKVVLVDFWTYTCINCIRTLPYLTDWYAKYKDKGLVIVGVHSPEFEFEKDTENVLAAIKQYKIAYPVAQDNNFATWSAYKNQYWPAKYLIDAKGVIRYTHFGEGEYKETEEMIQTLLKEAGETVTAPVSSDNRNNRSFGMISPETYLGSLRMEYFVPGEYINDGEHSLKIEQKIPLNRFSLGGTWRITGEYASSVRNAVLVHHFTAEKVFLVLKKGTSTSGTIDVFLDGKPISERSAGKDVKNGVMSVNEDRLYEIVDLHGKREDHILELRFQTPGIEAYAFTFG